MQSSPPPAHHVDIPITWEAIYRLGRLTRKELYEILRDRRTILTLVLMPLLLYPVMSVAFRQFFLANRVSTNQTREFRLGFQSEVDSLIFQGLLSYCKQSFTPPAHEVDAPPPKLFPVYEYDLEAAVRAGKIDVGFLFAEHQSLNFKKDQAVSFKAIYMAESASAQAFMRYWGPRLEAANEAGLASRLHLPDLKLRPLTYLHMDRKEIPPDQSSGMISLAALVPLILILMTITGAVYPAIDLTAGERERGTLEILMAAPVPRIGLLFAKYVSVMTVAMLTALVNLFMMMLTLIFSHMGETILGRGNLTLLLVVQMLGLLLLFALFFSAVLLSLTSFARSFKEAQAYLIPLMLVALFPGLLGMMPGLELSGLLAVTPLLNMVLMGRDLLQGGVDVMTGGLVVLTTLLYAGAAIALAARVFGAEGVLYNDQSSWSDLWRRPPQRAGNATVTSALWCLAFMVPAHFILTGSVGFLNSTWIVVQLVLIGLFSIVLFAGFPTFALWWARVDFRSALGLRAAHPLSLLGALILGASLWPIVLLLVNWLHLGFTDSIQQQYEVVIATMNRLRQVYPIVLYAALIAPALAEEFFFRGFLFGALLDDERPWTTIGATAALFALTHVIMGGGLGAERLLPSAILGAILGWVRWTSGSVIPGMLLHALHNGLMVRLGEGELASQQQIEGIYGFAVAGLFCSVLGALLVWLGRRFTVTPTSGPSPP